MTTPKALAETAPGRRQALRILAGLSLASCAGWRRLERDDELARHRIRQVEGFHVAAPRPKFVGKNAQLDDHGDQTHDDVLILTTDQGASGFGSGRIDRAAAEKLIGMRVSELWADGVGSAGPLGRADHALFDLVGKIRGKPSWSLIGSAGVEEVPVYDGSIYFNDLRTGYERDGVPRLIEEVEQGLDRGFRGFKIKVGRGNKWMPEREGFARDVEVVTEIRRRVGPDVHLMVDANNGFKPEKAIEWVDAVGDQNLLFVEEMFPEEIAADTRLRDHIAARGWKTLVADGESAHEIDHFAPFLKAGCLDVIQPDVRAFGLSLEWLMSVKLAQWFPTGKLAPHNWGSHLGGFMQLTLGRALGNFLMAEIDTSTCELFDSSAFKLVNGRIKVPDTPGNGLVLNGELYRTRYQPGGWKVTA